jgi:hypothetical protein
MSAVNVNCPYCGEDVRIEQADDYAPEFHNCRACGRRFIAERRADGVAVMKEKEAPCLSNPECREIETSATCEE